MDRYCAVACDGRCGLFGPLVGFASASRRRVEHTLSQTPIVVDTARGSWITDVSGKKYLDCTSGIGVTSTGHCHPA